MHKPSPRSLLLGLSLRDGCLALSALVSACATGESLDAAGDAGALGSGGSLPAAGGAGAIASGGSAQTNGGASSGGGGVGGASKGGSVGTGGGNGGGVGGSGTGGSSGGTGGVTGTGGKTGTGGVTGTGGKTGTGGATGTGGKTGTGGATGTDGTACASNSACSSNVCLGGFCCRAAGCPDDGDACTTEVCASGTGACNHVAANRDLDRKSDCQEDADGIFSTSKYVFNGVIASLVGNGGGNCTEICLASQISSLFASPLETKQMYSGWEFNTKQPESQSSDSATFGFQPPFTQSVTGFRVLYRGEFWVPPPATGQYCFNVDIGSDGGPGTTDTSPDACGAIYLPDVQANAWAMNGRHQSSTTDTPPMPSESDQRTKCTTFATAGPKRIDFVYQYSAGHTSNRHQMHVKYCYGNASSCTPATPIDDTLLTPVNQTIPTCTDGVKNGGETGLDCGGPDCAPC
ncbi:MAG TPA: hypothetical protein VF395_06620 [Polyangiaceae bacterium]